MAAVMLFGESIPLFQLGMFSIPLIMSLSGMSYNELSVDVMLVDQGYGRTLTSRTNLIIMSAHLCQSDCKREVGQCRGSA